MSFARNSLYAALSFTRVAAGLVLALVVTSQPARAADEAPAAKDAKPAPKETVKEQFADVWTRDKLTGDWEGWRTDLLNHGIDAQFRLSQYGQRVRERWCRQERRVRRNVGLPGQQRPEEALRLVGRLVGRHACQDAVRARCPRRRGRHDAPEHGAADAAAGSTTTGRTSPGSPSTSIFRSARGTSASSPSASSTSSMR